MSTLRPVSALLLSAALLCPPAPAQSPSGAPSRAAQADLKRAHKAAERGDKAEAAGQLDEALLWYEEATRYAPQDVKMIEKFALLRSQVVQAHIDAAERAAVANQFERATEELGVVLAMDPTNSVVAERLGQIKNMEDQPVTQSAKQIEGLPRLEPQAGTRDLSLRGDTRTVYEQLGNLFGVKAVFDPDLSTRNVQLHLDKVDFKTAMSVLGAETATFWRPLSSAQFLVAADTPEKRRQYSLEAVQTFPLSAAFGPEDVTEALRIVRDITGSTHLDLDSRSRTITMRDTPERLALAGALIQQIERARGEVLLEIELLEVDRNTAQKLGVEPPSKAQLFFISPNLISQLTRANNLSAIQTLLAAIFGGASGGTTSLSSLLPSIVVVGGGKSIFLLTLPAAAAHFSDALSLVHGGRQILLRAQDGKPATFFVGERYPITLSLLSQSLGTVGFTPNPGGTSNLFPSTSYGVGKGPAALVAGDLRNHGVPDLAVLNEIDNSVTVLLNQQNTQGTFVNAPGSPIALGPVRATAPATPPSIASAVFTSSGCHDLLASDPLANAVDVLISNCDGTFKAPVAIAVGSNPTSIVTGDFDGDGKEDFAVANEDDDSISIFLGDGTGNFSPATNSPFPLSPQLAIRTTSLPDGVVNAPYNATLESQGGTGAVSWSIAAGSLPAGLTLNSTGTISGTATAAGISTITVTVTDSATPPVSLTTPLSISMQAVAPPLAISTSSLPNGSIGVPYHQLLAVTGGISPFTWSLLAGSLPTGLSLNSATGEITGTPTSTTTPVPSSSFTVAVMDSRSVPLTAEKQFTLTPLNGAERGPVAMAVNDFNSDGKPDLAVVNQATNNVTILLGNSTGNNRGTFSKASGSPITVGNLPVALASGDLAGKARADLAIVNQKDATVTILLNNGDATFAAGPNSPLSTASTPTAIAITDFNQDGHSDLAITSKDANTFRVFLGASAGIFTLAFEPPAGPTGSFPTDIIAANLVSVAPPDVAITNNISGADGEVTVILSPANLFSSLGNSIAQQPYPASEYVDLGVKIKATPTLHPNSEVTLQLEFEIRALSGENVNGIPIISNRTLSQTVRVKQDQPTLIAGLTDTEETWTITGWPGLATLPRAGLAFGTRSKTLQDQELLILVTPRIVRLKDHLTRTIFAGRADTGGGRAVMAPGTRENQPPQPQPPRQQQ